MFLKTVYVIPFVRSRKVRTDHVTRKICKQNLEGNPEKNRALGTQD